MSRKPIRRRRLAAGLAAAALAAAFGAPAPAAASEFRAALTGANAIPPGDPDGAGTAKVVVSDVLNEICVELEVSGLAPATGAHIHRGAEGETGPPVVTLDAPDNGDEDDCDAIGDALADEIQANPTGFYINVHTAEHPEGAIRGQLMPGAD